MKIFVFWEDSFPFVDTAPIAQAALRSVCQAGGRGNRIVFATASSLPLALDDSCDLLLLPYGSAFPLAAWGAIRAYLERGGNWLNLGGAPLTRPAVRAARGDRAAGWRLQHSQTTYAKQLLILHSFEVALPTGTEHVCLRPELELSSLVERLDLTRAWALQHRFGREPQSGNEQGSTGAAEGVCRPLVHSMEGGRTLAAPFVAVDRVAGPCAGGRWVFAACCGRSALPQELIARLVEYALRPPVQLLVGAGLACYHKGEKPAVRVTARCRRPVPLRVRIRVEESGREIATKEVPLVAGGLDGRRAAKGVSISVPVATPGMYTITATAREAGPSAAGAEPVASARGAFWIRDAALLRRQKALTLNRDYFLKDGKPLPVAGTTYMCGEVWRHFLFEPRPAQWDVDFAAMKAAGVNMVRTGMWGGWQKMMDRRGGVREPVLRAMEAWLLTAARHEMPVIYTFFAFTPPAFGGKNCYIDPTSLQAQEKHVRALARRFADVPHLMYDFINEPSFGCPQRLWRVSPNYDSLDRAAWERWSRERCPDDLELADRWRRAEAGDRSLPKLPDFDDGHVFQGVRPVAARDYRLYGQEMFNRWTQSMVRAVRGAGSRQLLTVGQDEGATADRPNPWFHGPLVDFTTNHTWWFNDDLLWDSVVTKTPDRPNLIEETGIMFFERPDGAPARTLEGCRNLLEQKMALSLACGCAGFIQWLWKTDPLMPSDNESAAGFHHIDGSEKPELEAFRRFSRFFRAAGPHMTGRRPEEACVVLPHSLMFSVRNLATTATRQAVRVMEYRLGVPCRAVSEGRVADARGARLIVLPSPRVLTEECWKALLDLARGGATILVTGFLESDEYWRLAARLDRWGLSTRPAIVEREERVTLPGGGTLEFTFAAEHHHRGEKAVGAAGASSGALARVGTRLSVLPHGRGKVLYCPVPAELAQSEEQTAALYRFAAGQARLDCPAGRDASLLVRPVEFDKATLYILLNESGRDQATRLRPSSGAQPRTITVPAGRVGMVLLNRKSGEVLAKFG